MIEPKVIIIGFNEVDALKTCIPSLLESGVPKEDIYFFDGPFPEFPHEYDYSTDGTLDYLKEQGIKVVACGEMTHMDKQNYRFEYFKDETALFYVDCDETIVGDWKKFCEALTKVRSKYPFQTFGVTFCDMDMYYTDRSYRGRIFLDAKNWNVKGRHWHFYYKGNRVDLGNPYVVGGIQVFHDSSCRPKTREQQMVSFQKVYTPKEQKMHLQKQGLDLPPDKVQCHPCGCTIGYVFFYEMRDGKAERRGREINIRCRNHSPGGKKFQRICPHCRIHTQLKCEKCNHIAGEWS